MVGDGTQTRDFVFVTDVVRALVTAAGSNIQGQIMNIGSGRSYSVNQLVELLGGEVVYVPKRPGEPDCTHADTTRVRDLLGWTPQVSFEQGVAMMLENIDYLYMPTLAQIVCLCEHVKIKIWHFFVPIEDLIDISMTYK